MTPTTETGRALLLEVVDAAIDACGDGYITSRLYRAVEALTDDMGAYDRDRDRAEAARDERVRLRALRPEMRAAISNAYYDTRHEGQTMEVAADRAVDAVLALLDEPKEGEKSLPTGPSVTWRPADRTVLAVMAPIVDGLCPGCGTKPSRETGSCRCLFRIDAALRSDEPKEGASNG